MYYFYTMEYIDCVGLIVIKDRKLLLAFSNNKKAWYLPGGKVDAGETPVAALRREIKEELNVDLTEHGVQWYYHITAPAFAENNLEMRQHCYRYDLRQTPQATAEIGAVRYFGLDDYLQETHQAPGVLIAFRKLQQDGLVD
jgi:8-oxo-dGTP pyrophosphatase MutT (NUDIX family)